MQPADHELLLRVGHGDKASFAEFYDRYSARIYGLIVRMVGRTPEADDILQESFWQVWQRAAAFDPSRGTPFAWLVLIARSRALDQLRRAARRDRLAACEALDRVTVANATEAGAMRTEAQRRATTALERLPSDQKLAIQLAFYGGLTYAEIAERQGQPLGTVKTRIRLGMQKLRDILSENAVEAA
ncbi:MAG: sigma-70 family RNA polymerase sigma factor [Planctomycetes bacterium]|nr:sigma-70 family RNA polymerase sigma factor [Planctomycetota bacterium]